METKWSCFCMIFPADFTWIVKKIMETAMLTKPNPIHKRKWHKVNYDCPYFEKCIEYATVRNWQYWGCAKCPHKAERALQREPASIL